VGPRWRKVFRDLRSYRGRTLLVVISIAVGVLAVGMIVESRIVLGRQLEAEFLASDPANAELRVAGLYDDFVTAAARTPGVGAAEGRRTVTVQVQVGSSEWVDLELRVLSDFAGQQIDLVSRETGTWPPANGSVAIERSTMDMLGGAAVGDSLTVRTAANRTRELRVAGTAYASGELAGYDRGNPYGFISVDTLEWLGYGRSYDTLLLRVAGESDAEASVTAVAGQVADQARAAGLEVSQVRVNAPLEYPGQDTLNTVFVILVLLGALTLVVSVFLVVNTVSAVLGTQTRQIGVMKAVGARDRDLRRLYRGLVLGYGLFAAVLSIPLAALGSIGLTAYTAGLLNLDTHMVWPPPAVIGLEIAVAIAVPLVAAVAPISRGVRITVREAIASAGISAGFGTGPMDRAVAAVRFLPRAARFALRNTFRHRRRLVITLAALALGGAVFMAVLSVQASLNATLERGVAFFGFDAQASLVTGTRAAPLTAQARQVPGVVEAEAKLVQSAQRKQPDGSDGQAYQVVGTPSGSAILDPVVTEGRWLLPGDDRALVATDNILADEPDLRVGQTLELTVNGRTSTWTLVGVIQAPTRNQVFYTSLDALGAAAGAPGRANTVAVTTTAHDPETQDRIATALRDTLESRGMAVKNTVTIGYIRDQQTMRFDVLVTFLAVMAALVGAVGGIGLSGTMSLNVSERTREIGVLRSIGASNRAVRTIFLVEGWAIGLMAWLAGIILALPISMLLSRRIGLAFVNRPLEFAFSPRGVGLWLAVVLVVSTLATLAPAVNASRVPVRETLSYE
jgi:putative ABC transport system permease protein